jgi:hypothetical protein
LLSLAAVAVAVRAEAQDVSTPPRASDPRIWLSVSGGPITFPQLSYLNNFSRENVDASMTVRGTAEIDIGRIGSLGVSFSRASYDVQYVTARQFDPCREGCPATLQATTVLGVLRVGGGMGFEQVFEASAGLTMFGDLESESPLYLAREAKSDFTAGVGYGVTYGFTPALSAMLVADIGLVFHDNPNDEADIPGSSYSHFLGLRAGVRYGFWSR